MSDVLTSRTDTEVVLRRLLDESEIRAVLARYARGIDRDDEAMVRSCYFEDATDAHGHYNGDIDGFLDYCRQYGGKVASMTHHFGQSTIELDGDSAWVESYCLCLIRMVPDEGEQTLDRLGNIRYVDLFERRDGEWKIAKRKLVHQPGRLDPVLIDPPLAEQAFLARYGTDDPSYDRSADSYLP